MEHISKTAVMAEKKLQEALQNGEQNPATPSTSPSNSCPLCGGTGWVRIEMPGSSGVTRCDCAKKRIVTAQLNAIPDRFRGCTLGNYVPVDQQQMEALQRVQQNIGRGLVIWGGYGRGKTHLAVAQYRALVEAGQSCCWRTMAELNSEIRNAELKDEFSKVLDRARYSDSFHLFIDDIDKYKPTEFKNETLFDLFDTMYKRNLSITVTSNWSLAMLVENERVHPGIVRRLDDMCLAVQV